jgi:Nucleoside 2-deoxyribosyltransferase like
MNPALWPNSLDIVESLDYRDPTRDAGSVFLAGGMKGCPDWRAEAIAQLSELAAIDAVSEVEFTVYVPRRIEPGNTIFRPEMVNWEYDCLRRADVILFWFPQGDVSTRSEQPIALYELGAAAASQRAIVVGAEAGYACYDDLVARLGSIRPELTLYSNLQSLTGAAYGAIRRLAARDTVAA